MQQVKQFYYTWDTADVYTIELKVIDSKGRKDTDTAIVIVNIRNEPSDKPDIPECLLSGKKDEELTYSSITTDPDNEEIWYWFDWGDGTNSGWIGPYNSGQTASKSYAWGAKGTYCIKVKAKDTYGVESDWSDSLRIRMSKNNQATTRFLQIRERPMDRLRSWHDCYSSQSLTNCWIYNNPIKPSFLLII